MTGRYLAAGAVQPGDRFTIGAQPVTVTRAHRVPPAHVRITAVLGAGLPDRVDPEQVMVLRILRTATLTVETAPCGG